MADVSIRAAFIGRRLALASFLATGGFAAADGDAYRVRDLRTEPTLSYYFSADLAAVGSAAVLSAGLPGFGVEPWVSDGTPEGTSLLRDLAPGRLASYPAELARLGPLLLFSAWSPGSGQSLWVTDGTSEETRLLLARVAPGALGVLDGVLYFSATEPVHGRELWRSDGTVNGTWLVSDLRPGAANGICGNDGAVAGDLLFFCGFDDAGRGTLWASDGSRAGSRRVVEGQFSPDSKHPSAFLGVGQRVYFSWWDAAHGRELWSSDGTAEGTALVTDLVPGPEDSHAVPAAKVGDRLLFVAYPPASYSSRPWSTDGTEKGTVRLAEVEVEWPYAGTGELFPEVGDRVVFFGWTAQLGGEPWSTDGTPQGTFPLGDFAPGGDGSMSGFDTGTGHDGVYFCAQEGDGDFEIWRTDGKPPGTVRVAPADGCHEIRDSVALEGETLLNLCWWYNCGPHSECDQCRLWRTDGSLAGTEPFWPDPIEISSSAPSALTSSPTGIVFGAIPDQPANDDDRWLVRSDGTDPGTVPLTTPTGEPVEFWDEISRLADGSLLLAGMIPSTGAELWRTDGDSLALVREILPGPGGSSPDELTTVGDWVYLAAYDGLVSEELWRSDGTDAGTTLVLDIAPGERDSEPYGIVSALGRAWFGAESPFVGVELWESGGTPESTIAHDLARGGPPASSWPQQIRELDAARGRLTFRSGRDLYSYLPASRSSTFLKSTRPSAPEYGRDLALVVVDSKLYFVDEGEAGGCELWRSDGTIRGTARVAAIGLGPQSEWWRDFCPDELVPFGGRLFFTACEDEAGCELWTSDGSAAGTGRFADLSPGPSSFLPTSLTPIGDRMVFSACTEDLGCEPWITDGTPEGTTLLADVAPGPPASDPAQFTFSQSLLFFAADDGTGTELWAMPVEPFYDGFEDGTFGRWSGAAP